MLSSSGRNRRGIVELYQTRTLFAFPSTVETFGNPLVEAMSCGAPIVSSNTAAMPEILGDAARFFDPLDVEGMAGAISDLMGNARERQVLSKVTCAIQKIFMGGDRRQNCGCYQIDCASPHPTEQMTRWRPPVTLNLTYFLSHPIQYQSPLLRRLALKMISRSASCRA